MTTFLLDLWHDLREKRLWPVAVALVAATIAVPVAVLKPASSGAPSGGPTASTEGAKLPAVSLDDSSIASSSLGAFKERNPFTSHGDKTAAPGTTTGQPIGQTVANQVANSNSSSGGTSGSTTSSGSTSTQSSGTSPKGPDGHSLSPGVHYWVFTVDASFGTLGGKLKTYKGLGALDLLPPGKHPVIAFMGVETGGKKAMFFIADAGFHADGEGHCKASDCRFFELTTSDSSNEETITSTDGTTSYTLQLKAIHFKAVDQKKALGSTTPAKKVSPKKASKKASLKPASVPSKRKPRVKSFATLPELLGFSG